MKQEKLLLSLKITKELAWHSLLKTHLERLLPLWDIAFNAPSPHVTFGVGTADTCDFYIHFNGELSEQACYLAINNGQLPHLDIYKGQNLIGSARVMCYYRGSIKEAFPYVVARLATLIAATLNNSAPEKIAYLHVNVQKTWLKDLLHKVKGFARNIILNAFFYRPHWRISYRLKKSAPLNNLLSGDKWIDIKNPPFRFLADPFIYHHHGEEFIFVEDFDHRLNRGLISVIAFKDGKPQPPQIIIDEPHHLSYPLIFHHQGEVYMLPEGGASNQLTLYRALEFPLKWVKDTVLIDNINCADSTPFLHNGKWWMLTSYNDGAGSSADILHLYFADSLKGQWISHPQNPIRIDCKTTRPAGNVFMRDGKLYRPVQDCENGYGGAMIVMEITHIDEQFFHEEKVATFKPHEAWRGWRLHSYNASSKIEVIDGSDIAIKIIEKLRK